MGGGGRPKERKLNMRRLSTFEYRLKKLLEGVEAAGTIFGNIRSKSANRSTAEAKQYVEVLADDGNLEIEKASEITDLLNRFSTMR